MSANKKRSIIFRKTGDFIDTELSEATPLPIESKAVRQTVAIAETTIADGSSANVDFDLRDLSLDGFFALDLETSVDTSGDGLDDVSVTIAPLNVTLKDSVTVTFDIDLVADDGTVVTINTVALADVPWDTDNDTTLDNIGAAILAHANVEAVAVAGTATNKITVTAKPELDVVINSAVVTNTSAPGSEAVATIVRTADVATWVVPTNSAATTIESALDISTIGAGSHWVLNTAISTADAGNNPLLADGFRINIAQGAGGAGKVIGKLQVR